MSRGVRFTLDQTDNETVGRITPGTRVAMVVVGAIWTAVGVIWLRYLFPGFIIDNDAGLAAIPTAMLFVGLVLLKNGLLPGRPKTFEEEKPDANPDLEENVGDVWCE